jgi:hypothetical protein
MALVVPNASEVILLARMLNVSNTNTMVLKLFSSNTVPVPGTLISNLTECSQTGYTPVTLTNTSWAVAASPLTGAAVATYAEQTFTFSSAAGGVDIYGYYVTDTAGTPNLLWVERFSSAPFSVPPAGGQIAITPTINLENL